MLWSHGGVIGVDRRGEDDCLAIMMDMALTTPQLVFTSGISALCAVKRKTKTKNIHTAKVEPKFWSGGVFTDVNLA